MRSGLVAACMLAASIGRAAAATPEALSGSWQAHDLQFAYQGITTFYSCEGLVAKLQVLLKAAGAREDAKVSAHGCTQIGGHIDRFASARLVFHSLALAGGTGGAGEGDNAQPVQWRRLRIANNRPLDLASGDCELVEQFRDAVLRKAFVTRNAVDRLHCVPHQIGQAFSYDAEVLSVATPAPASR